MKTIDIKVTGTGTVTSTCADCGQLIVSDPRIVIRDGSPVAIHRDPCVRRPPHGR